MSAPRSYLLPLAAMATLVAGAATAQSVSDLAGAWQGAVITPGGRAEITLTVDAQGKAVIDNAMMGFNAVPVEGPTLTGNVVRFAVPAASAQFEGRLSEDRKTITGSLSTGRMSLPLVLTHSPVPAS